MLSWKPFTPLLLSLFAAIILETLVLCFFCVCFYGAVMTHFPKKFEENKEIEKKMNICDRL